MPADSAAPTWPVMSIAAANAALGGPGSPLEITDGEVDGVKLKVYVNAPPTIRSILEMAAATIYQKQGLPVMALRKIVREQFELMHASDTVPCHGRRGDNFISREQRRLEGS